MKIEKTTWQGETAVYFEAGGYQALMIPGVGANVIKLEFQEKGVSLLRTPENLNDFKERPQVYGLPLLFPPNRIEDGTYTVNGRTYNLPINAATQNNHIHGFIRTLPFNIIRSEIVDDAVQIEASFISNASNNAIFEYFPHEFECRLFYSLSKEGLEQRVTFVNISSAPMPLGVGFHTAFNIPFHPESEREDYRLIVSADERIELNSRNLPTGNIIPLNETEKAYRNDGMWPFAFPLDTHYSASTVSIDGRDYHGAIIIDTAKNIKLFYEVGNDYKFWTLWNCGGNVNFFCPEPQTWAINAPNLDMPPERTGLKLLPPGESWSEVSKIYIK